MSLFNTVTGYGFDAKTLLKRCQQCPNTVPQCPVCASDETCTLTSPSCDSCATTTCVKTSSGSSSSSSKGGSNAGPIAGGVVGGVAFIIIVVFLVWWLCIRKKRKALDEQWAEENSEKRPEWASNAQSRRSVASIASTVLTRASNVIQIAYIPGVTNRSPPSTPHTVAPPVPPIPASIRGNNSQLSVPIPGHGQDQHFFLPGDLRDSTWSGMSDGRNSITPSLARSSVATTIYGSNAVINPVPAQQALRGKANMVSVRSNPASPLDTPGTLTPDVPAITPAQLAKANALSPASVNSSMIMARQMSARQITVGKGSSKKSSDTNTNPSISETPEIARTRGKDSPKNSSFDDSSSDEEEEAPRRKSRQSVAITLESDGKRAQSPFADSNAIDDSASSSAINTNSGRTSVDVSQSAHRHRTSQASNRLSGEHGSKLREESPFSDANEVRSS